VALASVQQLPSFWLSLTAAALHQLQDIIDFSMRVVVAGKVEAV